MAYHSSMTLASGISMKECAMFAKVGHPMHCNSSRVTTTFGCSADKAVLLDFYDQDPQNCPLDWKYISVLGNMTGIDCLEKYWGLSQTVREVDMTSTDLLKFCTSARQS